MVIFRECNIDFYFITGILANQLIFKGINERMRTDFKLITFTFSAFKCFAVYKAFEINNSCIFEK